MGDPVRALVRATVEHFRGKETAGTFARGLSASASRLATGRDATFRAPVLLADALDPRPAPTPRILLEVLAVPAIARPSSPSSASSCQVVCHVLPLLPRAVTPTFVAAADGEEVPNASR